MKATLTILLTLSITVNVGFLTGCATFHDAVYGNPCKYSVKTQSRRPGNDDLKASLVQIANLLDIRTDGLAASDIERAIINKLDRPPLSVPRAMDDAAIEKLTVRLIGDEKDMIREYQRFISDLQEKRVIVIELED